MDVAGHWRQCVVVAQFEYSACSADHRGVAGVDHRPKYRQINWELAENRWWHSWKSCWNVWGFTSLKANKFSYFLYIIYSIDGIFGSTSFSQANCKLFFYRIVEKKCLYQLFEITSEFSKYILKSIIFKKK